MAFTVQLAQHTLEVILALKGFIVISLTEYQKINARLAQQDSDVIEEACSTIILVTIIVWTVISATREPNT